MGSSHLKYKLRKSLWHPTTPSNFAFTMAMRSQLPGGLLLELIAGPTREDANGVIYTREKTPILTSPVTTNSLVL